MAIKKDFHMITKNWPYSKISSEKLFLKKDDCFSCVHKISSRKVDIKRVMGEKRFFNKKVIFHILTQKSSFLRKVDIKGRNNIILL